MTAPQGQDHHPARYVITEQIIGILFAIVNLYVVIKEIRNRRRNKPEFKSCSLKWLSLLSIFGGFLLTLCHIVVHLTPTSVCPFVTSDLQDIVFNFVPISVGLYELSRLYQCFADEKVPGGYPKWLFYAMTNFAILHFMVDLAQHVWDGRIVKCGLTKHHEFYDTVVD